MALQKYHKCYTALPESSLQQTPKTDSLLTRLHGELVRQYGPLLQSADLVKVFGYRTSGAFRQAMARGTVPVPLFTIAHRRGHFALTLDVATWMVRQRRAGWHPDETDLNAPDEGTQTGVTERNLA